MYLFLHIIQHVIVINITRLDLSFCTRGTIQREVIAVWFDVWFLCVICFMICCVNWRVNFCMIWMWIWIHLWFAVQFYVWIAVRFALWVLLIHCYQSNTYAKKLHQMLLRSLCDLLCNCCSSIVISLLMQKSFMRCY